MNKKVARDIAYGNEFEKYFVEIKDFEAYSISQGWCPGWDIKEYIDGNISEDTIRYWEVKADTKTIQTGNIAVEYESAGTKSGILTTISDFWVQFVVGRDYYYCIPVPQLKAIIKSNNFRTARACEEGKNRVVLIPERFVSQFRINIPIEKRRVI